MKLKEIASGKEFLEERGIWERGQKYKNRKHLYTIIDEGDPVMILKYDTTQNRWKKLGKEDRETAIKRLKNNTDYCWVDLDFKGMDAKSLIIIDNTKPAINPHKNIFKSVIMWREWDENTKWMVGILLAIALTAIAIMASA